MKATYVCVISSAILLLTCTCMAESTEAPSNTTLVETPNATPSRPSEGKKPERIGFAIYVLDIDEISGQNQNFAANFVASLQWKDKRLAHSGKFARIIPLEQIWHPMLVLTNRQAGVRMPLPGIAIVEPDGTVTYRQQYVGPLSQRLRLHDFPLDTQTFSIHFAITGMQEGEIELVPREPLPGMKGGGMAKELSLPDWGIVSYKVEVRPYKVSDTIATPGFAFEFVAKRYSAYFIWQAAMPLILIVMMSWVPFWVDPKKAELQFAIAGSAVLTLIAFRFTLARMLPPLPYLTRMDLLTISATILVFAAFLQVVLTSLLAHRARVRLARIIDLICRVGFPIVFIALILWSILG
jgi:hypothetical protein